MGSKSVRTFLVFAVIAVQINVAWLLIARSRRKTARDNQISAQLSSEFAAAVGEFQLDVNHLDVIEDHPPVTLTWKPYFEAIGGEITLNGSVHISGPMRYPAEMVGRLKSTILVSEHQSTPNLVTLETTQSFGSLRLKKGREFFPNMNVSHVSHATITADLRGKVHEYSAYVTVDGKTIESPISVPLLFPDRAVGIGDSWGLDENIQTSDAQRVTLAVARLSRFVEYQSIPHAVIQAEVNSTCSLKKAAAGIVELPPDMLQKDFVDVTEKRTYLIRVGTCEVIWFEVHTDMGALGEYTARMKQEH